MTVAEKTEAYVPGPGGFATSLTIRQALRYPPDVAQRPFDAAQHPSAVTFPIPRLSAGLRLHGEYQGSGFTEPRYIARRGDGQVVQLTRLLHLVAGAVDGQRDTEGISHRVSALYGREVSADNVQFLIDKKLIPLGVVVPWGQENDEVDAPRSDLLLALKGHRVLFNEHRTNRIGRSLAWLHRKPVVVLVLLAAVAMDVWLFGFYGAITPVLGVLDQPVLMLAVFGLTVASLVFHEFGHASACQYGGARPGCIGCGLYLIWPSMYTDVTDVYRIDRKGRIRTDLGGVYFNVIFMLFLTGCYLLTGQPFFLSAVYLGHFEVLEQLMPAVRLDGYYILGDIAGVPDLFGKIRPIVISMLPGRSTPPEVAGLKRSTRVIVTIWVVTMVPLLLGDLGYALWNLPRILSTGARSLTEQLVGTGSAFVHGQIAAGLVGVLGSLMLVLPLAGMTYLCVRLSGRLFRAARRSTAGKPRMRIGLSVAALAIAAALGCAWAVGITPKPLPQQPPIVPALQPGVTTPPLAPSNSASPNPSTSSSGGTDAGHSRSSASSSSGAPAAGDSPAASTSAAPGTQPSASASGPAPTGAPTATPTAAPSMTDASPSGAASASSAPTSGSPSTPPVSPEPSSSGQ